MANKKVVVAFSGGLDTSYTVMKLTQDGWDVYAACANTGGFSAEQLNLYLVFLLLLCVGIYQLNAFCFRGAFYAFRVASAPFAFGTNLRKSYDNAFFCICFWGRRIFCPTA